MLATTAASVPGGQEDHHGACQHGDVEAAAEIDLGQVAVHPRHLGRLGARLLEHGSVQVHPDHVHSPPGQLDGDATRAAAGVEDGPGWSDSTKSASP
jgi:hypothetical protein